jgi:hypothetical protein
VPQIVERLPRKHEGLSSNPNTTPPKKERKKAKRKNALRLWLKY